MTPDCTIIANSPAELIAVTPYVLGFHPADSLVVIGTVGRPVVFGARWDLPPPEQDVSKAIAMIVATQRLESATVIGYGPANRVTPAVLRLAHALSVAGVGVHDALRVTDGRWWSYVCDDPRCCPPEGQPCRAELPIAAEAVFRGQVALPSRQALIAQVAPVAGAAREAMTAATERARARIIDLLGTDLGSPDLGSPDLGSPDLGGTDLGGFDLDGRRAGRSVRRAGRAAVLEAERRHRAGRPLSDDQVAWLGVLLVDVAIQDYALDRSDDQDWRIRLWTDVVRRVDPRYAATPACLLGFTAWRDGNGSLARVAVDRALTESPGHRLAGLLDHLLCSAIGPDSVLDLKPPRRR